jgi:hypothetical protein
MGMFRLNLQSRLYCLIQLQLRHMGALLRDVMPQRHSQCLAAICKELRIVRSAGNGDISHAVVKQILWLRAPYRR